MKKIIIGDRECTMTCNLRALTSYQRVSGCNPFDLEHMTDDQKALYDATMGWCMLSSEDQDALPIEVMMEKIDTLDKQVEFSNAVAAELTRFYKSEPGDKDMTDRHDVSDAHRANDNDNENEKYEKNA